MSHEPPTPPAALSIDLLDTLNGCSSEKLKGIAGYAEKVSKHKTESDEDEIGEQLSDLPENTPGVECKWVLNGVLCRIDAMWKIITLDTDSSR